MREVSYTFKSHALVRKYAFIFFSTQENRESPLLLLQPGLEKKKNNNAWLNNSRLRYLFPTRREHCKYSAIFVCVKLPPDIRRATTLFREAPMTILASLLLKHEAATRLPSYAGRAGTHGVGRTRSARENPLVFLDVPSKHHRASSLNIPVCDERPHEAVLFGIKKRKMAETPGRELPDCA